MKDIKIDITTRSNEKYDKPPIFEINKNPDSIKDEILKVFNYKYSYYIDTKFSKEYSLNILTLDESVDNDFRILNPKIKVEYNQETLDTLIKFEKELYEANNTSEKGSQWRRDEVLLKIKKYLETLNFREFNL